MCDVQHVGSIARRLAHGESTATICCHVCAHPAVGPRTQLFMRLTVLVCDALVFIPAVFAVCGAAAKTGLLASTNERVMSVAVVLAYPVVVLIDHGHFQYNCVALGLVLWGTAAALQRTSVPHWCVAVCEEGPTDACVLLACAAYPRSVVGEWRSVQSGGQLQDHGAVHCAWCPRVGTYSGTGGQGAVPALTSRR